MTGSPYRTALLGTGRIGSHHARTIHREVHGLDLVLLADPVAGIARTLAEELGVERAGTDPVAAATDEDVDAVVITTPARTHVDLVAATIEAGKHVFVEKPMALTVADNDRSCHVLESKNPLAELQNNLNCKKYPHPHLTSPASDPRFYPSSKDLLLGF